MTEPLKKAALYINHNPGHVFGVVFVFSLSVNVFLLFKLGGWESIVGVLLCLYGLSQSKKMNENA